MPTWGFGYRQVKHNVKCPWCKTKNHVIKKTRCWGCQRWLRKRMGRAA